MVAIGIFPVLLSMKSDGNTIEAGHFATREDASLRRDDDQGLDPGKGTQTIKL